jgi:predicted histidine transporter YuiF (NhaC family)
VWANGEIIMVFEANMNATEWFRFTGTAALGGVRALAQFFVLSYTTATTMSVANTFALVLNIVISLIWQDEEDDEENEGEIILLYAGIGVVILFSAFYAYLKSSTHAWPRDARS